jgi:type II secretory pathway pseudopilin PulG
MMAASDDTKFGVAGQKPSDAGFSLTELLVYVILASLVLAVGANIISAVYRTQQRVTSDSVQSQSMQLAFSQLSYAMRNTNQVQAGTVTGGYLLVTRIANNGTTYPRGADICRDWMYYPNSAVSGQPQSYTLYTRDFALNSGIALTASSTSGWTPIVTSVIKDSAADPLISAPTTTAASGGTIYGVTFKYALLGKSNLAGTQKFYSRVVPSTSLVGTC